MTTTSASPPPVEKVVARPRAAITVKTLRNDRWWLKPLLTVVFLTSWVAYATVRVFMQKWYFVDKYDYLTPFYSPCVSKGCTPGAAEFGRFLPDHWFIPFAVLTLPFLLLFRLSCYYYRGAYYRSYWLSPPSCAVPDGHKKYTGETRFPLLGHNAHRYFWIAAVIISIINTWDAIVAQTTGLGLGNIILWINVILLWAYTLSCHSSRHIFGGRLKHFSKHPVRYRMWTLISKWNTKHMELAWITLSTLAITDFYIMAVSAGWFSDPRIIG